MKAKHRTLYMKSAGLLIDMRDGETQEDAEDRLIETLESLDVRLLGWKNDEVEIDEWDDDEWDDDDASGVGQTFSPD